MLRAHPNSKQKVRACYKCSSLSQSMDIGLPGQSVSQREREREIERERDRERERERERERGEKEKDVEYGCFILILTGMTPFSYLVYSK